MKKNMAFARNFEEDNIYSLNQIEPLYKHASLIAEDCDEDHEEFLNKTREYMDKMSMAGSFNELKEKYVVVDYQFSKVRHSLLTIGALLIICAVLLIKNIVPSRTFGILMVVMGLAEIGFLISFLYYNSARKKLLAQIKDTESAIDL